MPITAATTRAMRMLTTANYTDHVSSTLQFGRTIGRQLTESTLATTSTMATPSALDSLTSELSVATLATDSSFPFVETTTTHSLDTFSDQLILNEQQAELRSSSLFSSIEEFSHWTSTESCTALIHALLASFSVILVSELGDKTFIITAIMAMKNSRSLVFISSAMALFLMTVLSVGMGVAVTVIPKLYTHYASIVLFLCFGLKMLKEAYDMKLLEEGEESEFDEVKRSLEEVDKSNQNMGATLANQQLKGSDLVGEKKLPTIAENENTDRTNSSLGAADVDDDDDDDSPINPTPGNRQQSTTFSQLVKTLYIAPVVIKVFTMVFIAEWGDRSQISTVILAAREDVVGVFVGSLSGHVLCTGLAVIGGRFVADMISVRTMTLLGGIIFLFFASFAIFTGPETP